MSFYLPALYVSFSHYFSHSLFQQRRWWQCLCSRSPLYCHLCRTMVSLMSCYMHCSSKMWVCHNNIILPFLEFKKKKKFLMPTHSVHSKLLLSVSRSLTTPSSVTLDTLYPPIPSIFLNCCIHPCIFQQLIIHVLDLLFVSTGPCHQRSAGFPA